WDASPRASTWASSLPGTSASTAWPRAAAWCMTCGVLSASRPPGPSPIRPWAHGRDRYVSARGPATSAGPSRAAPGLPRILPENQHPAGGEHAAVAQDHADVRAVDLGGRLTADLADAFLDGEHPVHPGVR